MKSNAVLLKFLHYFYHGIQCNKICNVRLMLSMANHLKYSINILGVEFKRHAQGRSQGLPGWANRPPGRPKWGRNLRKFEGKWEKLQKIREEWGNVLILPTRESERLATAMDTLMITNVQLHQIYSVCHQSCIFDKSVNLCKLLGQKCYFIMCFKTITAVWNILGLFLSVDKMVRIVLLNKLMPLRYKL